MKEQLTHWKQLTNPDYIGAYSLQPGEERTVEIISVSRQQVTGADGKKEECTVAILKNEKPFILNSTNCKTLTKLYGTPYIEQWQGKHIIIYAAKIKAFGEEMEALRIKPVKPSLPELNPSHPKWKDAVKALSEGKSIDLITSRFALSVENRELLIAEAV
jgi:hypothetical protein